MFPAIADLDEVWKPVAKALFKSYLPLLSVLPVATSVPERKKPPAHTLPSERSTTSSEANATVELKPVKVKWCKVSDAYFCTPYMSFSLEKTLLDIGFRLLSHTPNEIHESFKTVKGCEDVSPQRVREFLQHHGGIKEDLPKEVKNTVLCDVGSVKDLTMYCAKAEDFFENLVGVPLLLTQDGVLRVFSSDPAVFCSRFSQLLPSRPDLFLHDQLRSHYSSDMKKCSNVIREFLIPDLAKHQAFLFPSAWINNTSHQPWHPTEQNAFPSKVWIKLIWVFIDAISSESKRNSEKENKNGNESKPTNMLANIAGWHIIPTTTNCLAPVSMGKTVLNVSTYLNSDSTQDKARRELLVKLGCPQFNHTILTRSFTAYSSSSGGATAVRKHYLAMVQSTEDVLGLLHQTLNSDTGREAALNSHEIETLLMFLQTDTSNLSRSLLKDLPFYQTINSTYTRLPHCSSVYQVPASVPSDDLQVLSRVTDSIFLREAPKLSDLYQYIEITKASSVNFYLNVVLTNFDHLSSEGRVNHLKYVRDHLLAYKHNDYNSILCVLKQLRFIPDHSGTLCTAEEFYDPENKVFKKFVPNEKFPPSPFDSEEWKEFLVKAGLQCVVTEEHVLQYARELQAQSRNLTDPNSHEAKEVLKKSSVLVSHLFQDQSMHTPQFLSQVSKIHFVPAANVKQLYLDIHPAHTQSILTCYNGSVIEGNKTLVWSSASSIQTSAVPHRGSLMQMLGIHSKPPHELVISHVKNISARFAANEKREVPSNLQVPLSEVMTKIYSFFSESCRNNFVPSSNCTRECVFVAEKLRDFPIVLVDRHTLVRGNQLALNGVWETMKPYMFNIPRSLSCFDHFLQCLGAQERPTPLQYSSVLERIKTNCADNQMDPNEISAANAATRGLFLRLSRDATRSQNRRPSETNVDQSLANVQTLYLPTEGNFLKPSCEVYVNDTMEKKDRLKDYWKELLIDLTMRDEDPPTKLVELLPSHLKVKKLSSKLKEELSPSCIDKVCLLDQNGEACDFIKRYRDIICSTEFSQALMRLYKYQQVIRKIPEEVQNDLRRLERNVTVACMQTIEVRLVVVTTGNALPGSVSDVSSFCQRNPDGFCIRIKHGGESNSSVLHERLSSFIAGITGQHIVEANWRFLMMILGVNDPCEISKTLDDARVPRNVSNSTQQNLGEIIPEHFHDRLKNDINYHLRAGEIVGYEVREDDENDDAVFVYAQIIEKTTEGNFLTEIHIVLCSQYFVEALVNS